MIYNTPCVSCQLPMNGGVYRKPNQCPHCLTLQNPHKSADSKCLASVASDTKQVAVPALEEQPEGDIQAPHKATVIAFDRHLVEVEELTEAVFSDEGSPEEHQNSEPEVSAGKDAGQINAESEVSTDINEEQENTAVPVNGKRKHFDNLEVKPDLDESLDIALHIDGSEELIADEDAFSVDTANFLSMEHAVVAMARETHLRVSGGDSVATAVDVSVVAGGTATEKGASPADAPSEARADDSDIDDASAVQESQLESIPVLTPANNGATPVNAVTSAPAEPADAPNAPPSTQHHTLEDGGASVSGNDDYENVVLTTESAHVVGVEQHIDLVTAECVVGMDRVKQDLNKTQDFSRKEYGASPSVLKEARKTVLDEIKKEAFIRGADTVVDVQLDYNEISRGDAPMMMVVATGTAVKAHVKEAVGAAPRRRDPLVFF